MNVKSYLYYIKLAILVLPLVILLTITFHVDGGKSLMSRAILISTLASLFFFRKEIDIKWLVNKNTLFFSSSVVIFTFYLACHLLRGDEFSLPRTLLLSIVYLVVIPWHLIPRTWFYIFFALGAIWAGSASIYEHFFLHISRVGVTVNPIPYALYCAGLAMICFCLVMKTRVNKLLSSLLWLGFIFAVCALILTSVRGVMLFLPVVLIITFLTMTRTKLIGLVKIIACMLCSAVIIYAIFDKQIEQRIDATKSEVLAIMQGNMGTSIGARFVMWQHGIALIKAKPILGVGAVAQYDYVYKTMGIYKAEHLHNQYIDTAVKYGMVGLILTLFWLFSTLLVIKHRRLGIHFNPVLFSLLLLYLLAGLTDTPLHHTHMVYFYTLVAGIFLYLDSGQKLE